MIEKKIFLSKFISFHNVFPIITTECPLWIRVLKFSHSISEGRLSDTTPLRNTDGEKAKPLDI